MKKNILCIISRLGLAKDKAISGPNAALLQGPRSAASSSNEHKSNMKICIISGLGKVKTISGPSATVRTG